jgi:hypothetical protein
MTHGAPSAGETGVVATPIVRRGAAGRFYDLAHRWLIWWAVLALAGVGVLYYLARRPILPIDDATLYVTGAQALAQGQGYRLPGYIGQPFNTFYPPGYSLFLMPCFWLQPAFPGNLSLLQLANLAVFYALLALAALTLRRCFRATAMESALALLLVATTPLALLMSTAVMSDTLFGALALGSTLLIQRGWSARGATRCAWLLAAVVVATLAYYTRSAGLALIAAFAIDALRRMWARTARGEALISLLPIILIVPWSLWSAFAGGSGYTRQWVAQAPGWSIGVDSPENLLIVVLGNLIVGSDVLWAVAPSFVHPDVGFGLSSVSPVALLVASPLFIYAVWQSWRSWQHGGDVVHLFLLLYLLTTLILPWRVLGRYIWPVAPLLAWYLVSGLRRLWDWASAFAGRPLPRLDRIVVGLLLLANGLWLGQAAGQALATGWVGDADYRREMLAMAQMAEHLRDLEPTHGPLATNHLSTTSWWYLYTGRPGLDAVARADGSEPYFVRRALAGDPESAVYFVYQRPNGSPTGGAEDLPVLREALSARGDATDPLYCAIPDALCLYDFRPHAESP